MEREREERKEKKKREKRKGNKRKSERERKVMPSGIPQLVKRFIKKKLI